MCVYNGFCYTVDVPLKKMLYGSQLLSVLMDSCLIYGHITRHIIFFCVILSSLSILCASIRTSGFFYFFLPLLSEHSLFSLSFPSLFILYKEMHLGSTRCSVILRFTVFLWCALI